MKYNYYTPATEKLPAPISGLGRVIKAMSESEPLTTQQVFGLAYAPHENFHSCKAMLCVAQARGYVEKVGTGKREGPGGRAPSLLKLTDKGAAIQRAIEKR